MPGNLILGVLAKFFGYNTPVNGTPGSQPVWEFGNI